MSLCLGVLFCNVYMAVTYLNLGGCWCGINLNK